MKIEQSPPARPSAPAARVRPRAKTRHNAPPFTLAHSPAERIAKHVHLKHLRRTIGRPTGGAFGWDGLLPRRAKPLAPASRRADFRRGIFTGGLRPHPTRPTFKNVAPVSHVVGGAPPTVSPGDSPSPVSDHHTPSSHLDALAETRCTSAVRRLPYPVVGGRQRAVVVPNMLHRAQQNSSYPAARQSQWYARHCGTLGATSTIRSRQGVPRRSSKRCGAPCAVRLYA